MGLPEGYAAKLPSFYHDKRLAKHARGSAVGNAWHVPQLVCCVFILLAHVTGVKAQQADHFQEPALPGLQFTSKDQLRSAGLLDVKDWLQDALRRLEPYQVPSKLFPDVNEDMLFILRVYEFTQGEQFIPGLDLDVLCSNEAWAT